jgi:transcriptional regulator with XRE-family HTH domain
MQLSQVIRERREELQLTQADLADLMKRQGYSRVVRSTLSHLETGRNKRLPDPEFFSALADALDLPPKSLLIAAGYLATDEVDLDPETEQLAQRVTALPDERRKATIKAMHAVLDALDAE